MTNSNLAIGWRNLADGGSLATTAPVATRLPLTNLQAPLLSQPARFTDPSNAWFTLDLGAERLLQHAALWWPNATAEATLRLRAANSQGALTAAPLLDITTRVWPPYGDAPSQRPDLTARWLRWDLLDPGNPDGYLDAARLWAGPLTVPTRNLAYGWSIGSEDPSRQELSRGGQIHVTEEGTARLLEIALPWASEAEALGVLARLQRSVGRRRDLVVYVSPDDPLHGQEKSLLGLIEALGRPVNTAQGVWEFRLLLREQPPILGGVL